MASQPESLLKHKVMRDLKKLDNTYVVKIQQMSIHGTPDILACVNGLFVAIELKKDAKSKPTAMQIFNLKKISKAGGFALVVTPAGWAAAFEHLVDIAHLK